MHYLDYNATSPLRPDVQKYMMDQIHIYGNPSSVHGAGRQARASIERVREKLAAYLSVHPANVIFTSSATEANHLMIQGIESDVIITSDAEHDAIYGAIHKREAHKNTPIYYIPHHSDGTLDQNAFDAIIAEIKLHYKAPLLSLIKVNNETGIVQDLTYYAQTIREIGGIVHSDAVQALGKISFDDWIWQCDAVTLTPHKVGGPKAIGILILKDHIALTPLITGGGQEMRRRAGTENFLAIMGLGALLDIFSDQNILTEENHRLQGFKDFLETEILSLNPDALIVGQQAERVANTLNVITKGIEAEKQVIIADLNKVCLSSGAACSSGKVKSSHVLKAYGFDQDLAQSAIRISMGFETNMVDCYGFIKAYEAIIKSLRSY